MHYFFSDLITTLTYVLIDNFCPCLVLWLPKAKDYSTAVGENIIATTKIRNNYGVIQSIIHNIGLFSIAPCKIITFNPLSILFGISTLLLFDGFLSKVITLPSIAIAIVAALSRS